MTHETGETVARPKKRQPQSAKVDFLVDERGSPIDVPDNAGIRQAGAGDTQVGGTGPANWWRLGLLTLAVLIAILLAIQLLTAGGPAQP